MSDLSKRIRTGREKMKLNRRQFGELIGVSPGSIDNWENGSTVPLPKYLEAIEKVLSGQTVVPTVTKQTKQLTPRRGMSKSPAAVFDLLYAAASEVGLSNAIQHLEQKRQQFNFA